MRESGGKRKEAGTAERFPPILLMSKSFYFYFLKKEKEKKRELTGPRVSKGSGIYLCFCYYFEQARFVMFKGLMVFLFMKLLYYTAHFFN